MATAHSPNDLTRQQLDELDALLQKMLALPLNGPESAAATLSAAAARGAVAELPLPEMPASAPRPPSPPAYSPPIPTPFPLYTREVNPLPVPPVVWRGEAPATAPSAPQLLTLPSPAEPTPAPASRKAPSNRPVDLGSPLFPNLETPTPQVPSPPTVTANPRPIQTFPPITAAASTPAPSKGEPALPILVPFVMFNRALNSALDRMGLAGRILQTGLARNLLGVTGLGLVLYSAAKLAQIQNLPAFSAISSKF